jgi:predicted lipoprotein with Yx(FWY)xxD motif
METHPHERRRSRLVALIWSLALASVLVTVGAGAASGAGAATVKTHSSSLGKILVDAKGRTLYLFEKDKGGKSTCYGQCAKYWPPLLSNGKPTAGAGAQASLLGTARRSNGTMQVTYAHHPLYRYVGDTHPGQTTGQGSKAFGAGWYVLRPTGKKIDND